MAVGSANDATIAFASQIAGSEQGFVVKMNEMAERAGIRNSSYLQAATGLQGYDYNLG